MSGEQFGTSRFAVEQRGPREYGSRIFNTCGTAFGSDRVWHTHWRDNMD
jgi:hypothetical protein